MIKVNLVRKESSTPDWGVMTIATILVLVGVAIFVTGMVRNEASLKFVGLILALVGAAGAGEEEGPSPDGFPDG